METRRQPTARVGKNLVVELHQHEFVGVYDLGSVGRTPPNRPLEVRNARREGDSEVRWFFGTFCGRAKSVDVRANQTQIVRTQRGYFYAGLPKIPPTCILNPPPLRKKRRTKRVYASVATRHSIQRIKFATSTKALSPQQTLCHFDEGIVTSTKEKPTPIWKKIQNLDS